MRQLPLRQFLILLGGMLALAIPLSLVTFRQLDKEVDPTLFEETQSVLTEGYVEIYSTAELSEISFFYGDRFLGGLEQLESQILEEFELELPKSDLSELQFKLTGSVKEDVNQAAIQLRMVQGAGSEIEKTLWVSGEFETYFNF